MANRTHLIPFHQAETLEDAEFIAPDWANFIIETDDGFMCFEEEPEEDIWSGRDI